LRQNEAPCGMAMERWTSESEKPSASRRQPGSAEVGRVAEAMFPKLARPRVCVNKLLDL
jgi:hypothetical protein